MMVVDDTPVVAYKGLIVGPEYQQWTLESAGIEVTQPQVIGRCLRMTLVTNQPLSKD